MISLLPLCLQSINYIARYSPKHQQMYFSNNVNFYSLQHPLPLLLLLLTDLRHCTNILPMDLLLQIRYYVINRTGVKIINVNELIPKYQTNTNRILLLYITIRILRCIFSSRVNIPCKSSRPVCIIQQNIPCKLSRLVRIIQQKPYGHTPG